MSTAVKSFWGDISNAYKMELFVYIEVLNQEARSSTGNNALVPQGGIENSKFVWESLIGVRL